MEAKLLAVARQPLRDVLVIMRDMGLRRSEVFRMRWGFAIGRKEQIPRASEAEARGMTNVGGDAVESAGL